MQQILELERFFPSIPLPLIPYLPGRNLKEAWEIFFKENLQSQSATIFFHYGIDLYHARFFYEAHEVWEYLWMRVGKKSREGLLLKGLIQHSAASLKLILQQFDPALRLSRRAVQLFEEGMVQRPLIDIQIEGVVWPFLAVKKFYLQMQRFYLPFWQQKTIAWNRFPLLRLA